MKMHSKWKIFLSSTWVKVLSILLLVITISLVIFLPLIINNRPKGSIIVFNRDASSGTREVFIEKMLGEDPIGYSPSKLNAREVSTNDAMINNVNANKDSLGYVSFGTVANFDEDGNAVLKEGKNKNINFSSFENVLPSKENITSGEYGASRDFNEFFRVDKNSVEANILKYDWEKNIDPTNEVSEINDDELKVSYLFYSWTIYSINAFNILEEDSEISESDKSLEFNKELVDGYFDSVNLSSKNDLKIEVVGSSSAGTVLSILSKEFRNEMNDWGYEVIFEKSNFGSADAFKKKIPGTQKPYIGLQSRKPTDNELLNWNWEDKSMGEYSSFVKDAILLIYNNEKINSDVVLNTTSELLDKVYSENEYFHYSDVFTNFKEGDINA